MGADHPIAWSHAVGRGRAWYTGGGHTAESYAEPLFRAHLLGGVPPAGCKGPRFASVAVAARSRRVTADVRAAGCLRACTGSVRARASGRRRATALRATAGRLAPRPARSPSAACE